MLRGISRVLLLVALLTAVAISSASAFAGGECECFSFEKHARGCRFDKDTNQCININCAGFCF